MGWGINSILQASFQIDFGGAELQTTNFFYLLVHNFTGIFLHDGTLIEFPSMLILMSNILNSSRIIFILHAFVNDDNFDMFAFILLVYYIVVVYYSKNSHVFWLHIDNYGIDVNDKNIYYVDSWSVRISLGLFWIYPPWANVSQLILNNPFYADI
ncbi:hypothetical protein ACJX0J_039163 [Zea mays]